MPAPKKPRSRPHDEKTITLALTFLAINGGRIKVTAEQLAEQGVSVNEATLSEWKRRTHAHRYHELREEKAKEIAAEMARQAEEYVSQAALVERKALDALELEIDTGALEGKDLATALQKISQSRALNMDKIANPLMGRADKVIHHLPANPQEIYAQLMTMGVEIVDSTAEEIPDAQIESAKAAYVAGEIEAPELEERIEDALEARAEEGSDRADQRGPDTTLQPTHPPTKESDT